MKKTILVLAVILFSGSTSLSAAGVPATFGLWGAYSKPPFSGESSKLDLYVGFTNGLYTGFFGAAQSADPEKIQDTPARQLLRCFIDDHAPGERQALAMIDKYYMEHPEKWNMPLGQAIVEALMVKGGSCAAK